MRRRKVRFISPEKVNQARHRLAKGGRGGRPPAFDEALCRGRNVIERCFKRLKQFRDLVTRYAKCTVYYRAEIHIAAAVLWLR